jgi:GNAT superfamily N-acetyltransferase
LRDVRTGGRRNRLLAVAGRRSVPGKARQGVWSGADRAREVARDAGHRRIALEVESPNSGAISLYRKCGFFEWERRVFVPFPGSDDQGEWILMAKDL